MNSLGLLAQHVRSWHIEDITMGDFSLVRACKYENFFLENKNLLPRTGFNKT